MKNIKRSALMICAALLLLAGCASAEKTDESASSVQDTATSSQPDVLPVQADSSSSEAELPEEQPRLAEPLKLKALKRKGLYKIQDFWNKQSEYFFISETDRSLLLTRTDSYDEKTDSVTRTEFGLYDMERGEKIGEAEISGYSWIPSELDDGYYTYTEDTLCLFDKYLGNEQSFHLPEAADWVWVAPDKKFVIVNKPRGASKMYRFGDDELVEVNMSQKLRVCWDLDYDGDSLCARNTKNERFRIMPTGTVFKADADTENEEDEYCFDYANYDGYIYISSPSGRKSVVYLDGGDENEYYIDSNERYLVTTVSNDDYTETRLRVYDLEKQAVSKPILFRESVCDVKICSGGRIFIHSYSFPDEYTCKDRAYILETSELDYPKEFNTVSADKDMGVAELLCKKPEGETDETNALLKELHDRFKVDVCFELNDPEGRLSGEICKPYKGRREDALEALRDFLALSPDELISQATDGKGLCVLFCDDIKDDDSGAFDLAGFRTDVFKNDVIAVEVYHDEYSVSADENGGGERYVGSVSSEIMVDLFSHEIIHLLDSKLYKTRDDLDGEWSELSPEDGYFHMRDEPEDYAEASRYTMYYYDETDPDAVYRNAYFTDSYAKTFPNEDRAQIGRELYSGYRSLYAPFADYPNITKKAELLISMLREAYPCLSKIPVGQWYPELALNKDWCEEQSRLRDEEMQAQYEAEQREMAG